MNKLKTLFTIAAFVIGSLPLMAQEHRASPHTTFSANADGNRSTVIYGRPYTKNPRTGEVRKIWGGLVPYGKVWRTGADEATLFITQKPLVFGATTVPAGCYTLYTLPNEDGTAKLIINKAIGQWGTEYDESQDLARIDLKKAALATPVDEFTMSIAKAADGGDVVKLSWENTEYTAAFTVQK